jgi:DNA-binding response OmpR family regulator
MPIVLLVDDDFTMASLLKTLLGMEGYQVETWMDKVGTPMEIVRRIMPDIIIMDILLGDLNGLDLVRELRNEPDLINIKVIMASGIDKSDECLAAGANAFLLKPYMPEELFSILRQ